MRSRSSWSLINRCDHHARRKGTEREEVSPCPNSVRECTGPQDDFNNVAPHRYEEDSDDDEAAQAKHGSLVVLDPNFSIDQAGAASS